MAFITLGTSSQLQIVVPTKGTTDWADTLQTSTFLAIAQHDHTGSGNGSLIGAGAISTDAITGANIRLDNDEYLKARNAADTANISIIKIDTSNLVAFGTTLNSPVLLTPQIQDTSSDHQYIFAASELAADRTITLPLLGADDTFVFQAHAQTLTNKTLTTPIIASISNSGTITIPTGTDTLVGKATTDTLTNKSIDSDNNTITNIVNADIKAAAGIAVNKLEALTFSRALVTDGSGFAAASTTTATEIGYVNGVTSAIQTQIDAKLPLAGGNLTGNLTLNAENALRLADASGGEYMGLKAPATVTTSTTLTLPDGDGSSGQALVTNGSGTLSWGNPTAAADADVAKTSTYTATTSDYYIRCDASGGTFTVTLYAASGNAGKSLHIINTASDGYVTIDGNASETISGDTARYLSAGQSMVIECDGTNWQIESSTELIGYLKDQKATTTAGGTSTTDTIHTRTLNVSLGDFSKFGALSSSQFTLDPGYYEIWAETPAFQSNSHQAFLYNTSDTAYVIDGRAGNAASAGADVTTSVVIGNFSITAAKTFELRQWIETGLATNGLGIPHIIGSNPASNEVYSQVMLKKRV